MNELILQMSHLQFMRDAENTENVFSFIFKHNYSLYILV